MPVRQRPKALAATEIKLRRIRENCVRQTYLLPKTGGGRIKVSHVYTSN